MIEANQLCKEYNEAISTISSFAIASQTITPDELIKSIDTLTMVDNAFRDLVRFSAISYSRLRLHGKITRNLVEAKLNEPTNWHMTEEVINSGCSAMFEGSNINLFSITKAGLRSSVDIEEILSFSILIHGFIMEEPELAPENWKG